MSIFLYCCEVNNYVHNAFGSYCYVIILIDFYGERFKSNFTLSKFLFALFYCSIGQVRRLGFTLELQS